MNDLGLIKTDATNSIGYFHLPKVKCHFIFRSINPPSSTSFNNPQRFSLEQLKLNKRKLHTFKHFGKGWNGYNGEPIDHKLIDEIETLISDLEYQPQIFPTGRGSVQIEEYLDEHNFIEIEISNNGAFAYMVKNGKEMEKEISIHKINKLISEFYT